ncbi:MAG: sensor histidine kinase [Longimicrobiales bacterium]
MVSLPTLRRELVTAFALVFAGALLVFATGVALILPRLDSTRQAALYLTILLLADVAIFMFIGHFLLKRRVVAPIESMIDEIELIAGGHYVNRLPETETQEMARLAAAVNHMAERLIADQQELAANIRSLDETNRLLTEARDAMVRAEKMASVGRLGAGIAHEVGNPLGAILGYLGLLSRSADGVNRELVTAAEREAQRIDRIVRGLLEYARPRETKTQSIDVNAVVHDTIELLGTQGRFGATEVVIDLEEHVPPVLADPYQLQQVFVNLLVNATDAIGEHENPTLVLRTHSRAFNPPQHVPARRKDDPPGIDYSHRRRLMHAAGSWRDDPITLSGWVVEIIVADNGPGIPRKLLDQIFEPFVTTMEPGKGTGLGLAVCSRLVEGMGGTIRADSVEGEGATFTVTLPAAQAEGVRA